MTNPDAIQTENASACHLCNTQGIAIYQELTDRLFGASGKWTLKACPSCGLIWLDPRPTQSDVIKAYKTYYTHQGNRKLPLYKKLSKKHFLSTRYGYPIEKLNLWEKLIAHLGLLDISQISWYSAQVMYLPYTPNGRLLEIGFGNGDVLYEMQQLGWIVEGIDFDPVAVEVARQRNLNVHVGTLEEQQYQDNTFDAITMSHVIEHVHDPQALIKECYRILKPGGKLVILTPNTDSWGHQLYKENWRGLETPRHIHIFNPTSIKTLLNKAPFKKNDISTSIRGANLIFVASYNLKYKDSFNMMIGGTKTERVYGKIMQILEVFLLKMSKTIGEELTVIAQK